jgi:hypothetical protein
MVSPTHDFSLGIGLQHKHKAGDLTGLTSGAVLFGSSTGGIGQDSPNFSWDETNNRLTLQLGAAPSVGPLDFRDSSGNIQNCFDSNFAWACTPTSTAQQLQVRSRTGMGGVGGNFTFEIKRDGTNNNGNGAFLKITDNAVSAYIKLISNSFSQNVMDLQIHNTNGLCYAAPSTGGNYYYNPVVNTQRISILEIPTQTMYPGGGTPSPQGLMRIQVCPVAATSANSLVDTASLWIEGAPTQGVNMTMTNRYAALFQAGDDEGIPLGLRAAVGQISYALQLEDSAGAVVLGMDPGGRSITSEAAGFYLLQNGDTLGATGFEIANRGGFNGATLTNYSLDLVDFIYTASNPSFKVNWRYEARTSENLPLNNSSGEFQMLFSAGGGGNALSIGRGAAVFFPYVPGTGIDGSDGVVGIYQADPLGMLHIEARDATTPILILEGATAQSEPWLQFKNSGAFYTNIFCSSSISTSYSLTLPAAQGAAGQYLRNSDGAGTLDWATPSGSGVTTGLVYALSRGIF